MTERILLVDYENIQAVNLPAIPDDVKVRFVLGGKQASLPTALAIEAQSMGSRFDYVRILSVERNAFDFCIAFYLGEYLHTNQLVPRLDDFDRLGVKILTIFGSAQDR